MDGISAAEDNQLQMIDQTLYIINRCMTIERDKNNSTYRLYNNSYGFMTLKGLINSNTVLRCIKL